MAISALLSVCWWGQSPGLPPGLTVKAHASEMAMQMLKQRVWSSLNNADAWVLGIGVLSCLGLVTGVLG